MSSLTSPPQSATRSNGLIARSPRRTPLRAPSLPPPGTPDYFSQRTTRLPSSFPPSPPRQRPDGPRPGTPSRPEVRAGPLIPDEYIDVGSQRLYALSIFVIIQGWKIYDLTQIHKAISTEAELSFAFKYLVIEGLFLWALPVFRIPWLTFSPAVTVLQIVICSAWTIFLSSASVLPISAFLSAVWRAIYDREVSISEHRIRAKDIVHGSSYISGRHVVHILPESTAKLNPRAETFCIDEQGTTVYLPIRLNATEPKLVQMYHVVYDDTSYSTLNFTRRELRKMTEVISVPASHDHSRSAPSKILEVKVPVKEPGLYRLARVVDTSNLDLKLYQVDVLLSRCPSANIRGSGELSQSQHRCIGALDSPTLTVLGVPPLRVKYSQSIKGRDAMFSVQSIQPDHFSSPLLQGKPSRTGRVWHAGDTLEWALPQAVEVALDTTLGTVGRWAYMIDEVEDGLGNLLNYSRIYEDKEREDSPELAKKGLNYGFSVHSRPTVRFTNCNAEKPVNLAKGRKESRQLLLQGTLEEGPYKVRFLYTPSENEAAPEILELTMRNGREPLEITKPGSYAIESVQGKFCEGDVLESATCLALMPAEPTLSVKFEGIEDKCAGSIGVTADLTLTGTPPFKLRYRIVTDRQRVENKSLEIEKTRHQLQFRPDSAGHYAYEFLELGDDLYKRQLDVKQFRTEQTVKVLASASFARDSLNKKCCAGDSAEVTVNFHGTGPFTLTYEILHGNKRKQYSISDITEPTHTLTTPPLTSGGSYIVVLLSVEDGNGCKSTLSEADAKIEVQWQRPEARFVPIDGKMNAKAMKGQSIKLPLGLSGEAPWLIAYTYKNRSGMIASETVSKYHAIGDTITVRDEGVYEITGVEDAFCPGLVSKSANSFELSWFERPRLDLVESPSLVVLDDSSVVRKDICEGDEDSLEIALYGSPPFSVLYEREYKAPDGNIKAGTFDLQALTKYANIRMETEKHGAYKYSFKGISDSVYNSAKIPNDAFTPVEVQQLVHPRPDAAFANPGTVYKSCLKAGAEDSSIEPIQLKLVGLAPFTLTLHVKHENTGQSDTVTISNIKDNHYFLRSIYSSLGLGRHAITIGKVTDGRGCVREHFRLSQQVIVSVSDVPTISPSTPRVNYCVGDRISFVLTGVPPFEIEYEFNGKRQRAKTNSPFSRLASTPGNFTITSVKDSASSCKVAVHGDLTKLIHDVPTVKVSEGTSIIQDIHEGDRAEIVFRFSGAPPFALTYTRSEKIGRSSRELVLETHTISDIEEDTYSIYTSMEGVYEAISIEDRYCRARVGA
ncbi:hypothetical protein POJ06DRAFT_254849 [Lipomyces tetrasporus]|uniref:Nucleoporin Pom152 n=1 Tax=Lipomyces tetrasporus TaxID=54092 RepID=A0AAD7QQZ4_9ASCO|nr:uncharacterized protein POJ06DRAFT_254849 [Lipomyces tetrasporus]KAJ8099904.1 hypothetical protein POJ06DRAFT_254849 [Lipomyces tetrasporus]